MLKWQEKVESFGAKGFPKAFHSLFPSYKISLCGRGCARFWRYQYGKAIFGAFRAHTVFSLQGNIKSQRQDGVTLARGSLCRLQQAHLVMSGISDEEHIKLTLKEVKLSGSYVEEEQGCLPGKDILAKAEQHDGADVSDGSPGSVWQHPELCPCRARQGRRHYRGSQEAAALEGSLQAGGLCPKDGYVSASPEGVPSRAFGNCAQEAPPSRGFSV